jgi:hypothetical protein
MENLLLGFLCIRFIITIFSCSDETDPQIRIYNDRPTVVNVQIQTSGGNTINNNDVESEPSAAY